MGTCLGCVASSASLCNSRFVQYGFKGEEELPDPEEKSRSSKDGREESRYEYT